MRHCVNKVTRIAVREDVKVEKKMVGHFKRKMITYSVQQKSKIIKILSKLFGWVRPRFGIFQIIFFYVDDLARDEIK